jgi:peptidoglycan/xylan/chitin deacetylase (PgdA/CDA1 family)
MALLLVAALPVIAGVVEMTPSTSTSVPLARQPGPTAHWSPRASYTPVPGGMADDMAGLPSELPPSAQPQPTPAAVIAAKPAGPIGDVLSLPILTYHWIRVNPVPSDQLGFHLSVTPANFARQMDFLRYAGAHAVTLADAMTSLETGKPLPPRAVVLTFDDGYADFATAAAPVLRRDGLVGTVFVVSGFIGRTAYMNAEQVHQVDQEGMVVGCHTVNHVDLARTSSQAAAMQVTVSHQQLEALLGHKVVDFAYPYGGFTPAVAQMVLGDGFRDAVTTQGGSLLRLSQRGVWPRLHVDGADNLDSFAYKALTGTPAPEVQQLLRGFEAQQHSPQQPSPSPSPTHRTADGSGADGSDTRRFA